MRASCHMRVVGGFDWASPRVVSEICIFRHGGGDDVAAAVR